MQGLGIVIFLLSMILLALLLFLFGEDGWCIYIPVAVLLLVAWEQAKGKSRNTKTCPFCAEGIKAAATVCRYCNRELPNENQNIYTVILLDNNQTEVKRFQNIIAEDAPTAWKDVKDEATRWEWNSWKIQERPS